MASQHTTPAKSGPSSPTITPLHDPEHQAKVIKPAPLGVSSQGNKIVPGQDTTGAAGLGQKALLAKKMAKAHKPTISPTDQLQSPCTAKLNSAKQKKFAKSAKPALAHSFVPNKENTQADAEVEVEVNDGPNPFQ